MMYGHLPPSETPQPPSTARGESNASPSIVVHGMAWTRGRVYLLSVLAVQADRRPQRSAARDFYGDCHFCQCVYG